MRISAVSFQTLHRRKQKRRTLPEGGARQVNKREIAAVKTAAISSVVDLMGFEPTTSRMRTERARKVVSFLPRDCDVWSAKMDDHSFAGEKYFGGFSN